MVSNLIPNPFSAEFMSGVLEGYAILNAKGVMSPYAIGNNVITSLNDVMKGSFTGSIAQTSTAVQAQVLTVKPTGGDSTANPFYDGQTAPAKPSKFVIPQVVKTYGSTALKVYGYTATSKALQAVAAQHASVKDVSTAVYQSIPGLAEVQTVAGGTMNGIKGIQVISAVNNTISTGTNLWKTMTSGVNFAKKGVAKLFGRAPEATTPAPVTTPMPSAEDLIKLYQLLPLAYAETGHKMLIAVASKLASQSEQRAFALAWKGISNETLLALSKDPTKTDAITAELKAALELSKAELDQPLPGTDQGKLITTFVSVLAKAVTEKDVSEAITLRDQLSQKFEEVKKMIVELQKAQSSPAVTTMTADGINFAVSGTKTAGGVLATLGYLSTYALYTQSLDKVAAMFVPGDNGVWTLHGSDTGVPAIAPAPSTGSTALSYAASFTRNSFDYYLKATAALTAANKVSSLAKAGFHSAELLFTKDEKEAAAKKELIQHEWNDFTSGLQNFGLSLAYHGLVSSPSLGAVSGIAAAPNSWTETALSTPLLAVPYVAKTTYDAGMTALNATREYFSSDKDARAELAKKKAAHWNNFVMDFVVLMNEYQTSFLKFTTDAMAKGMEFANDSMTYDTKTALLARSMGYSSTRDLGNLMVKKQTQVIEALSDPSNPFSEKVALGGVQGFEITAVSADGMKASVRRIVSELGKDAWGMTQQGNLDIVAVPGEGQFARQLGSGQWIKTVENIPVKLAELTLNDKVTAAFHKVADPVSDLINRATSAVTNEVSTLGSGLSSMGAGKIASSAVVIAGGIAGTVVAAKRAYKAAEEGRGWSFAGYMAGAVAAAALTAYETVGLYTNAKELGVATV